MTSELVPLSGNPNHLSLPTPPVFESRDQERLHRKQRLAAALRIFGRLGFAEGVAGHITVRDPEFPDMFWVNPFGVSFRQMRVSDLLLVSDDGTVVSGEKPVNKAAFAIHSAIHKQRPDVMSAAHAHSVHGKAFSSLCRPLRFLTQDDCAFYRDIDLINAHGGQVVFDPEAGWEFASHFRKKAAIHAHHGLFTVGSSVDEATFWFATLERSCQAQLLALAAGDPRDVPEDMALASYAINGSSYAGWLSFQPMWQDIIASDPGLFE